MSLDAKSKKTLAFVGIAIVAVAGIAWTFSSADNSVSARPVPSRVANDTADDETFESIEVAVRSSPQGRSGRSRLEAAPVTEADQKNDAVADIEAKTKRDKKRKRRRTSKRREQEEETASAPSKKPHPPYGK